MSDKTLGGLSHLNESGDAHMVDVSEKPPTRREASASAHVRMRPETLALITTGQAKKGDVLAAARLAGIMAAKRTSELIPLCHALPLESVSVDITPIAPDTLRVLARAVVVARTGVEMEALTAATVAALTIYDMCKAVDRGMEITQARLEEKLGGRSGHYRRDEAAPTAAPAPAAASAPTAPAAPGAASAPTAPAARCCRLSAAPLVLQEVIDAVAGPGQGAIVTFSGVVRDHNQGKAVLRLHYEAYGRMVVSALAQIIAQIEGSIAGARVAIVHREGTLSISDLAVVIAASAPHRAEAFEACRCAIERLKQDVPIWKKEVSPSGEEWLGERP